MALELLSLLYTFENSIKQAKRRLIQSIFRIAKRSIFRTAARPIVYLLIDTKQQMYFPWSERFQTKSTLTPTQPASPSLHDAKLELRSDKLLAQPVFLSISSTTCMHPRCVIQFNQIYFYLH